ncbi:MAG: hypothetical protein H0V17_25560 [Deltaproteobacteria bacterium]|nr:hypothetical protein [Deltaproteobacteria bacterium]
MTSKNDDDDALDPMMRSMRSVWLDMRDGDAEPPARGFAELMAAARVKADAMQPETTEPWWRRGFAMLVRPPMLAAATVVVLVGGAVVLSQRNTEVPMRSASTDHTLRDAEAPAGKLGAARDSPSGAGSAAAAPSFETATTDHAAPVVSERSRRPRAAAPAIVREQVKDLPQPPAEPHAGAKLPADDNAERGVQIADEQEQDLAPKAVKGTDGTGRASQSDGVVASDKVPTARRPVSPPPTEPLIKQAEAAAKRSDCAVVKTTAERIRKLDSNVYKARVVTQPAIARCLK